MKKEDSKDTPISSKRETFIIGNENEDNELAAIQKWIDSFSAGKRLRRKPITTGRVRVRDLTKLPDDSRTYFVNFPNDWEKQTVEMKSIDTDLESELDILKTRIEAVELKKRIIALENNLENSILSMKHLFIPLYKRINNLEDNIYTYLWKFSHGVLNDKSKIIRYLPINIYLSDSGIDNDEKISNIINLFCAHFNIEIEKEYPARSGSFFKQLIAKTTGAVTEEDLQKIVKKAAQSLELELLGKKQAAINRDDAQAIKDLAEACKDSTNSVMQIGSVILIKMGPNLIAKSLNQDQLSLLDENPGLLFDPEKLITTIFTRKPKSKTLEINTASEMTISDKNKIVE